MGSIVKPALIELSAKANKEKDTEFALETGRFNESFKDIDFTKDVKEEIKEEKAVEESFEFNPEEIEPITVDRKKFAKKLSAKVDESKAKESAEKAQKNKDKDKEISE